MRPTTGFGQRLRAALLAVVSLPTIAQAQSIVGDAHELQRNALLALLGLAVVMGFALHRNGMRRILRLESASLSDPLTGVKNRRYLEQLIDLDIAASVRAHRTATKMKVPAKHADLIFMVIDLDNFKDINDRHGHAVGDRALVAISRALQQTCRDSDLLVRWGGDEFLVVQRFTDRGDAAIAAERFRRAVEQAIVRLDGGERAPLTCCVGYAAFPFRLDEPEAVAWDQVITLADLAAYSAKRDGRNESAGYVWNGMPGMGSADISGVTDPHMMLRLAAVRRETPAIRPERRPARRTQPRMRLNLG